jgi:threonine dehydrogenase-like Zn-dependent dehydrogenase
VAETGPGCTIAIGQQVYVIPYLACGVCVACRRGKTNCCQRIAVLGVHIDGGMADYVCVPEANVAPADGITFDQAAMIEFLAIGAHAIRRATPRKDDRILVVGAGPIGIGCLLFGKLKGSSVARTGSTSAATNLALITRSRRGRTRVKRCPRSPPATSSTS